MVYNELLMQFQADVLGVPVIRPKVAETTSLGAAYAAGLAVGFWKAVEDLRANWVKDKEWHRPGCRREDGEREYRQLEEGRDADLRLGGRVDASGAAGAVPAPVPASARSPGGAGRR
ncbi:MAG: hypothetical protein KatS3mg014_0180 [Actinomycetota bacterium]|nr:MAG: hypothetical protein KatS3mg014_0180 [Actinomycetota bacterium]